jgi:hypothetical protein
VRVLGFAVARGDRYWQPPRRRSEAPPHTRQLDARLRLLAAIVLVLVLLLLLLLPVVSSAPTALQAAFGLGRGPALAYTLPAASRGLAAGSTRPPAPSLQAARPSSDSAKKKAHGVVLAQRSSPPLWLWLLVPVPAVAALATKPTMPGSLAQ